jgi:hypothetical protein
MADLLDILRISDSLDEINGENISPEHRDYGMHYTYLYIGMSGEKFVDKMNANFHATDAQFLAHHDALNIRIISNQIKEIKVENGNTFYTLDGPDVPEEEKVWHTLQGEWGKIGGNLEDQTDLLQALNAKANQSDFIVLQKAVQDNYAEFQDLVEDVSDIANDLAAIDNQINNNSTGILVRLSTAEALLAKKISSDQVLEIRTTDGMSLEFTTDGHTWKPVSTAGVVEWGDIIGDIGNQADLLLRFSNIDDAIDNLDMALSNHKNNTNNPHQVTAAQVGLGNVDNTSDTDKPLSTAQKQYVDNEISGVNTEIQRVEGLVTGLKMKNMTHTEYEALQSKDSGTLYFINDL